VVFRRRPTFVGVADQAESRWLRIGLAATLLFIGIASYPVLFGSLTMRGY
jgi:hypothetical protein